ncbi:MAG: PepSY domain-containing protein [Gemmatimonadales bacterium]
MTRLSRMTPLAVALVFALPLTLEAQQTAPKPPVVKAAPAKAKASKEATEAKEAKEEDDDEDAMKKEATISEAAARATALKAVPGGVVQDHELEREDGKLIWSYDIKVKGKSGIEEVAVDAKTGAIVAHAHETPKDEQKEAAEDAAKAKAKAAKPAAPAGVKRP